MLEKVITDIAVRNELDWNLVEKIVRSQFKFVADTIEQGEFESVHLHYLGKFAVKPGRLNYLNKNNDVK